MGAFGSLLGTLQAGTQALLGDGPQHTIGRRSLDEAAALELASFEDSDANDHLQNAYREIGRRPLSVFAQLVGLAQAAITLGSVSARMVLLASVPGVIVSSRFGTADRRRPRRSAWGLAASPTSSLLIAAATPSVLRRAAQGAPTAGDFGLFVQGIGQLQRRFAVLLQGVSGVQQDLLCMRDLFEFRELPVRDRDAGETWSGPIERADVDVLRGVSFSVRRGASLALVGVNGVGKTTPIELPTRLHDRPAAGSC